MIESPALAPNVVTDLRPRSHRLIEGGRVLLPDGTFAETTVLIEDGRIASVGAADAPEGAAHIDARGRLVLPGIVDLHGDAFERQVMPRPGVTFPPAVALIDSDRQLVANGVTTAYHGLTYSWEPGLRGRDSALAMLAALALVRPRLGAETRLHLRFETFNLDGERDVTVWLGEGKIDLFAFNDHTPEIARSVADPHKLSQYAGRAQLSGEAFATLAARVNARATDVPALLARLAEAARAARVPMASHDDLDAAARDAYHALGCTICEFPQSREAALRARGQGAAVVFGAPNIVRGGSHIRLIAAAEMVAEGLCDALTTDYYYPALLLAPFRLAADGVLPLGAAWRLVSANPARAVALDDRGEIAPGRRADLILVDDADPALPAVTATIAAGRTVYAA